MGCMHSNKGQDGASHSISLLGPVYNVQQAEMKMSKHPTSRPKDRGVLEVLKPHNCDKAACKSNKAPVNKMGGCLFLFNYLKYFPTIPKS